MSFYKIKKKEVTITHELLFIFFMSGKQIKTPLDYFYKKFSKFFFFIKKSLRVCLD